MSQAQASQGPGADTLISAVENRRMFDAIAPRYDLLNRLMSFGMDRWWRSAAVRTLAPQPGRHYVDLGCGTGDLAFAVARRAPGATVTGIDPAERMLAVARQRLTRTPVPGVSFRIGDATALDVPEASLDGVITAFCVRNITDRRLAWTQIVRALKPGARLVILELTRPRGRIMRSIHRAYTRWCIPAAGRLVAGGAAYQYLVDSVEHFASPEIIARELSAAGFDTPVCRPLTGGAVTIFSTYRPDTPGCRSGSQP